MPILMLFASLTTLLCHVGAAVVMPNAEPRTLIRKPAKHRSASHQHAEQIQQADLEELSSRDFSTFSGLASNGQGYRVSPLGLVSRLGQIQFPYIDLGAGHSQAVLKMNAAKTGKNADFSVYRDTTCGEVKKNHSGPSTSMCTWKWDGKLLKLQDNSTCGGSGEYSCCLAWEKNGRDHKLKSAHCADACEGNRCHWCMVSLTETLHHIMPRSKETCAITLSSCLPSSTCTCLSGSGAGEVHMRSFADTSTDCRTRWHGLMPT